MRQKKEYLGPDFFNLIKYLFSILTALFSNIYIQNHEPTYLYCWIICAIISTLYSYYWDLTMDWGFLQP